MHIYQYGKWTYIDGKHLVFGHVKVPYEKYLAYITHGKLHYDGTYSYDVSAGKGYYWVDNRIQAYKLLPKSKINPKYKKIFLPYKDLIPLERFSSWPW